MGSSDAAVEPVNKKQAQETYDVVFKRLDDAALGNLDQVYVSGEGATAGYLATVPACSVNFKTPPA